jgi:1-acyl-sn-glycerol-3-phosphate acyltransferase
MRMNEPTQTTPPAFDRQAFERMIRRTTFLHQCFRPTIEGTENIPAEGGALLVTNS